MRWGMEILSPNSYLPSPNWFVEENRGSTRWTPAENKAFENALAVHDKDTPDRWQKIAGLIPGKTPADVMRRYKELEEDVSSIEAGLVPIPGYETSAFTLDWGSSHGFDGFKHKRSLSVRPPEQERKKGVPWTEEEHKLFLMGLKKYGKGDWRNISRNFVVTRTPTQVASHAQKYFIRQLSGGKDRRRASIHDITIVNLDENETPLLDNMRLPSPDCSSMLPQQTNSSSMAKSPFQWNQSSFNPINGSSFISRYGIGSYGPKFQEHGSNCGPQEMVIQMQPTRLYPHG